MAVSVSDLQARYPGAETFKFGDSQALCERLLAMVRYGTKRATCGALRDYEVEGDPIPEVGRHDIALDWDGAPSLVIRTTEVTQRRFDEVDEDFALAEGEDHTLAGWQRGHTAYFERNGGWSPDMKLVCERFEVVEDVADGLAARIGDAFEFGGGRVVLSLDLLHGVPRVGDVLAGGGAQLRVVEVEKRGIRTIGPLVPAPRHPSIAVAVELSGDALPEVGTLLTRGGS